MPAPGSDTPPSAGPTPVAVIDVGSNSIRMCVAELLADGGIRELEYLTQPVRLGVDTFRRGRIGGANLRAACEVLAGFRRVMETYGVERYRAVATSAVREAANCDAFLDRVLVSCGLHLDNVEGIEESRLHYQMVRRLLADRHGFADDNGMIFSLGSGSAEITVLQAGRVLFSETRRIGTLRLLEVLGAHGEKSSRRLLRVFLTDVAGSVRRLHGDLDLHRFYLLCPDILRLAPYLEATGGAGVLPGADRRVADASAYVITRPRFDAMFDELLRTEPAARPDKFGVGLDEAETLPAAATAVQVFWDVTRAGEAVLLDVSMLDCLLLDFSLRMQARGKAREARAARNSARESARNGTRAPTGGATGGGTNPDGSGAAAAGKGAAEPARPRGARGPLRPLSISADGEGGRDGAAGDTAADDEDGELSPYDDFHDQVISSAVGLGRRYHFDEPHALHVRRLCMTLFDGLAGLHGLGPHDRLLLEAAAILHDIGLYVSPASHHKHSMYLIRNSELMGLDRGDLNLIAVACRYHRRSPPRHQHPEFAGLPRADQTRVSKLASLLRIAESLDRSHTRSVQELRCAIQGSEVILTAEAADDMALEEWSLRGKSDLFEQLYGHTLRLRIRQAGRG